MDSAEYGEQGKRSGEYIAGEQCEKQKVAYQKHGLAGETVHYISAERAHEDDHERVAGKNYPYGVVTAPEPLAEIERQQRNDERKGEFYQKVAYASLDEITVPKFFVIHENQ